VADNSSNPSFDFLYFPGMKSRPESLCDSEIEVLRLGWKSLLHTSALTHGFIFEYYASFLLFIPVMIQYLLNLLFSLHTFILCLPSKTICRNRQGTLERTCSSMLISSSEKMFWLQLFIEPVLAVNCFILDIRALDVANSYNFSSNPRDTLGDLPLSVTPMPV
jgi:hypothetical protein